MLINQRERKLIKYNWKSHLYYAYRMYARHCSYPMTSPVTTYLQQMSVEDVCDKMMKKNTKKSQQTCFARIVFFCHNCVYQLYERHVSLLFSTQSQNGLT